MILRRLAQSLKEQNWTAISVEFVLLVLGVFLGIQAANWNEDRIRSQQSEEFTVRLREDLRNEAWNRTVLSAYYASVRLNARNTLAALEGNAELADEALLIAAYRASQYAELVRHRGTYDELTSTGNLGLIKDRLLLNMANAIYHSNSADNLRNEGINARYRIAFRMAIPIAVQDAIASQCGDRPLTVGDHAGLQTILNYECQTGLPQRDVEQAASVLRGDPSYIPLLRLRIADIGSQLPTIGRNFSPEVTVGIEALSKAQR